MYLSYFKEILMKEVKPRPEYEALLALSNDVISEIKSISPTAKAIIMIEDNDDVQLCTTSENLTFSTATGIMGAMKLRYEIIEAANFHIKMQAQQAADNGLIKLFDMNPDKGKKAN